MAEDVLTIKNLSVDFKTLEGTVHAIRNVTLKLHPGEVLALVGESGSGKSVTTKTVMQLLPKNAEVVSGSVEYEGRDLLKLPEKELQKLRGNDLAEIFQDPMTASVLLVASAHVPFFKAPTHPKRIPTTTPNTKA